MRVMDLHCGDEKVVGVKEAVLIEIGMNVSGEVSEIEVLLVYGDGRSRIF